jgi:hypothetical protein
MSKRPQLNTFGLQTIQYRLHTLRFYGITNFGWVMLMPKRNTYVGWRADEKPMNARQFTKALATLFGRFGGQVRFAAFTGISRSQVNRYTNGAPIPKYVALMVQMMVACMESGLQLPTPHPVARGRQAKFNPAFWDNIKLRRDITSRRTHFTRLSKSDAV